MSAVATDPAVNGVPPDPEPDLDELTVEGTGQLSMNLGGKAPTGATLALTGGSIKLVQGEAFAKGDRLRVVLECVVNEVSQKDEHESKTGTVTSCTQHHKARIVDIQVGSASAG